MTVRETGSAVPESAWFKSSYSTGNGGECVEIAAGEAVIFVRDSKVSPGPVLAVAPEVWAGFIDRLV